MKKQLIFLALSAMFFSSAQAAEPSFASDNEPQIVIRHQGDETLYEYRVNGELREIKVVPKVGPEYYLIPSDGDFIRQDKSQMLIPSWVIFSW